LTGAQLYCTFAVLFSIAGIQSAAELAGIRKFPISSNKSGEQQQIWSNSEILLAQVGFSLFTFFGTGTAVGNLQLYRTRTVHVFEAAEIQIRKQILEPCLLLLDGVRGLVCADWCARI
jgi:hypothetical protein